MKRSHQEVQVYSIQDRRSSDRLKRPWVVRWSVDGRQRSKSFHTRAEADRFRSLLMNAVQRGERFDEVTGHPSSWQPSLSDMNVCDWTRRWLGEQWVEWQPRTRNSAVESLAKLVIIAADVKVDLNPIQIAASAYDAATQIRTAHVSLRPHRIHSTMAVPAAFAALLGYHAIAMSSDVVVYEFDDQGYVPAVVVSSNAP